MAVSGKSERDELKSERTLSSDAAAPKLPRRELLSCDAHHSNLGE